MALILIVEDEQNLRFSIRKSLTKAGHDVVEAESVADALACAKEREFDLVLTDLNLGGGSGMELIKTLRSEGCDAALLVMTAYGTIESAVEAMKQGADDYLQKPLSLEELVMLIARSLQRRQDSNRLRLYERLEGAREEQTGVIGASEPWLATMSMIQRLATVPIPTSCRDDELATGAALPTVLLLGETGVGKGLLARKLHQLSQRQQAEAGKNGRSTVAKTPFVHVNCSALPATLIESELFGHEKGAFTDAKTARAGLFEMAHGGTIFLDEIGEMSLELQAKMLLVVEQGVYRRVGGSKERRVSARIIVATNRSLDELVEAGTFRRDLLYRLNALTVSIPPLRERGEDALLIADVMLERFVRDHRRGAMTFSPGARVALLNHSWPGNVRELLNAVQRAVMLCDADLIEAQDLGLTPLLARRGCDRTGGDAGADSSLRFDFERGIHNADEVERTLIVQALEHAHGNITRAAKLIGMNRSSFRYRLQRAGLEEMAQELANR